MAQVRSIKTDVSDDPIASENYYNSLQKRLDTLPLSSFHYGLWFLCTLGGVMDSMDLYLISFALPMIVKEWQLSSEAVGIVASGAMWGMLIGGYLWGILADRIGRRGSMQATVGIFGIVTGLCALAWNSVSMFVGRFIAGIGLGGFIPVDYAVISEFVPGKYRGRFMGAAVVAWPIGGLLGAFIAYNLAPIWGWRALFIIGAIPALLIFGVRFLMPESPRYLIDRGRTEEAIRIIERLEAKSQVFHDRDANYSALQMLNEKPKPIQLRELFSSTYRSRSLLTAGIWFALCTAYYGLMLWLPTLMTKYYNIPQPQALKYMMILTLVGVAGRILSMALVDTWGRKPVMISFALVSAIGIVGYVGIGTAKQFLIVAIFAAFFYEGIWAAIAPYTAELFPTRLRATGSGWASGAGRIAAALSPMLVGFVVDRSLKAVFFTFAGLLVVVAILVATFAFETRGKTLEEIAP